LFFGKLFITIVLLNIWFGAKGLMKRNFL